MRKAEVRTPYIAIFLRAREVAGLPFLLPLPEVRHHALLQLQLGALVVSRAHRHLLLLTRILPCALASGLVKYTDAPERRLQLFALPGSAPRSA